MNVFETDEILIIILTKINYETYQSCFLVSKHFNDICESNYLLKQLIDKRNNKMKHQYYNDDQTGYTSYLSDINKKLSLKEKYIYISTTEIIFLPLSFWFNENPKLCVPFIFH